MQIEIRKACEIFNALSDETKRYASVEDLEKELAR